MREKRGHPQRVGGGGGRWRGTRRVLTWQPSHVNSILEACLRLSYFKSFMRAPWSQLPLRTAPRLTDQTDRRNTLCFNTTIQTLLMMLICALIKLSAILAQDKWRTSTSTPPCFCHLCATCCFVFLQKERNYLALFFCAIKLCGNIFKWSASSVFVRLYA